MHRRLYCGARLLHLCGFLSLFRLIARLLAWRLLRFLGDPLARVECCNGAVVVALATVASYAGGDEDMGVQLIMSMCLGLKYLGGRGGSGLAAVSWCAAASWAWAGAVRAVSS